MCVKEGIYGKSLSSHFFVRNLKLLFKKVLKKKIQVEFLVNPISARTYR